MAVKERGSFYDQEYFVSPPLSVRLYRTYLKLLRFIWSSKARKTVITAFMTPRINKKGVINRYEKSNLLEVGETFYHHIEEHDIHVYKEGTPKVLLVYGWRVLLQGLKQ